METCLFYMEGFCTGSRDSFYRMDLCAIPKSSGSLMLNKAFVLSDLILLPAEGPKANNLCLFLCDKVPTKYVGVIKDMYNNVVTRVRTSDGDIPD